jgi:hypothetical protein
MKDQPPIFNRYQHPFGHTSGASEIILTVDLWQEGKLAPGKNPPVISPPVVVFRRIGVRAEIRTQSPVLSNTRLAKMVPLSHLRRHIHWWVYSAIRRDILNDSNKLPVTILFIYLFNLV